MERSTTQKLNSLQATRQGYGLCISQSSPEKQHQQEISEGTSKPYSKWNLNISFLV